MNKSLEEVGFDLCKAITNGIKNALTYPVAYIQENGAFVLECKNNDYLQYYKELAINFSGLCEKYQIENLADTFEYCVHKIVTKEDKEIHRFTFNISPEQLDNLLLTESSIYPGYRNSEDAGSILLLANPLLEAHKENVICAFPVMLMENNRIMVRVAGCNASELISTQLSYLVTRYLPAEAYNHSTKRYGHWGSDITKCIVNSDYALLPVALECITGAEVKLFQQSMEGFDELSLRPGAEAWIHDIDKSNENIYRLLGVTTHDELVQLKSLEIPVDIYLHHLLLNLQANLKNYEPGGDKAPGGMYYSAYDDTYHEELKTNLANLNIINSKVQEGMQLDTSTQSNEDSQFRFFRPNNECETSHPQPSIGFDNQ